MEYDCRFVTVQQIDINDATFRITEEKTPGDGIDDPGLLQLVRPPILLPRKETCTIISGFGQLTTDSFRNGKEIRCHLLDAGTPLSDCARIAVSCHALHRSLDIIESAKAIALLSQYFECKTDLVKAANRCGLSVNSAMVEKLLKVGAMPEPLKRGLLEGAVALPVALLLIAEHDDEKTGLLTTLYRDLDMSLNRQRELLEWVGAICKRDKLTTRQLLDEKGFARISNDKEIDRRQKVQRVRHYLKKRRYPAMVEFGGRYDKIVNALDLQKGTQLLPPAHFEGQTYALKIEFDSFDTLLKKQEEIKKMVNSSEIQELWKLM